MAQKTLNQEEIQVIDNSFHKLLRQHGVREGAIQFSLGNVLNNHLYVNVKSYGATGNGSTNDTVAIQNAINAVGVAGGGIVYFPQGTYKVYPQVSGQHCLYINYDNIHLMGSGTGATIISCYVFGGGNPDGGTPGTNFEVIAGALHRGSGIFVGSPTGTIRKNFRLTDLRLTGNAPRQSVLWPISAASGPTFPASPVTGDGWDLTHHAVWFENDKSHRNARIERCELDAWRGEVVIGLGASFAGLLISDCLIRSSNASAMSCSAHMTVERTTIRDCTMGAEQGALGVAGQADIVSGRAGQTFRDVRMEDCSIGLTWTSGPSGTSGEHVATNCSFIRCYKGGVWLNCGIRRARIYGCSFLDCGGALGDYGNIYIFSFSGGSPYDIIVKDCVFLVDTVGGISAFRVEGTPTKVLIENNIATRTPEAVTAGRYVIQFVTPALAAGSDVIVRRNRMEVYLFPGLSDKANGYIPLYEDNAYVSGLIHQAYDIANGTINAVPICEQMQTAASTPGYAAFPTVRTSHAKHGQLCSIVSQGNSAAAYFPKSGTGHAFKAPRYLVGAEFVIRYDSNLGKWVEVSYLPTDKSKLRMTANDAKLASETLESKAPTIEFYGCEEVSLAPAGATTFSTWANAPEDVELTVKLNANCTVNNSATLKLAGGVAFAPVGGGFMRLYRPLNSTIVYELSRFAY